ncbi:MAG TPA: ABC transporter ATP-binding protein [Ilumatobacteraceae bacterium]|nr:ABC transporter ATP-binding protein [Ilumatobacteraceae bacterium]
MSVVTIENLRIDVANLGFDIVDEVNIQLEPGELLGLVGESGSGKTTVGLSVLGHGRRGVELAGGTIVVDGIQILGPGENGEGVATPSREELRKIRGRLVTYVPQDPGSALNPALRIGKQLMEVLEQHNFGGSDAARKERLQEVMNEVLLPSHPEFLKRYPHQLSGGQQQRVGLAMAFACRPKVIVLDEPTTGLDVSTQAHVLETVRDLCHTHKVAALYVTHDLAVVANLADRVAIMYAGRIVEQGPTRDLFSNPAHPYGRHLMAAAPEIDGETQIVGLSGRAPAPGKRPVGCSFAIRCQLATDECRESFPPVQQPAPGREVRCYHPFDVPPVIQDASEPLVPREDPDLVLSVKNLSAGYGSVTIIRDVGFDVHRGECVAVVGESGSGKTTLSRSIGGLHKQWTGNVELLGEPLAQAARHRSTKQRLRIQYVFQNPYSSLNPRRTIGDSVARPLALAGVSRKDADRSVGEMLERVSLTAGYASRYPDQLSGGERQRVAIARALVSRPEMLICDEVTSALDVLVQAAIVELLADLRRELGLSMVFVTHNLPLVRSIAERVVVLADGRVIEYGDTVDVIDNPQEEYTRKLLADTPKMSAATQVPDVDWTA